MKFYLINTGKCSVFSFSLHSLRYSDNQAKILIGFYGNWIWLINYVSNRNQELLFKQQKEAKHPSPSSESSSIGNLFAAKPRWTESVLDIVFVENKSLLYQDYRFNFQHEFQQIFPLDPGWVGNCYSGYKLLS